MIDYLIHAYRRGADPFRSLSALSDMEAMQRMKDLYVEGAVFWERFKDPAQYLQARRKVEQWLRREFMAKGGKPQAPYPIYMVLGRSKWIQTMLDAGTLATTIEIQVPLSIFRECDVSFTYPDSMVSFMLDNERHPEYLDFGQIRLLTWTLTNRAICGIIGVWTHKRPYPNYNSFVRSCTSSSRRAPTRCWICWMPYPAAPMLAPWWN
jgi:hypothetical protein